MFMLFGKPDAVAKLSGNQYASKLAGTVKFYKTGKGVLVVADINGLPPNDSGFYGFHIHQGSSCTGDNLMDTGSHYSKNEARHPKHTGDLPPLLYRDGKAFLAVQTDRFSVKDVIGRTVVIHKNADDFTSQPAGNAGDKIACGVIKKQ